ncbi:MAG: PAC2 family protein [Sedimentisphaerales bacterium]|nr:PAC2 family protein [Sedimentisphaerales bacterium]
MTKNDDIFRFTSEFSFENPALIVGWSQDSGGLSPKVIDYINQKTKSTGFCEIEPAGFFPLAGVNIENDVAQFPQSSFCYSQKHQLVTLKASEPQSEAYKFLSAVLDVAGYYCKSKELYTINAILSQTAHTNPRRILAVFNQAKLKKALRVYSLVDMTWQGKPHLSSYLLWLAKIRDISGVSLWTEVPFYLAAVEDFESIKTTVSFFDQRFALGTDTGVLDKHISQQDQKLKALRQENDDINRCIEALEIGLSLNEQEQMQIIRAVSEALSNRPVQ